MKLIIYKHPLVIEKTPFYLKLIENINNISNPKININYI